MPETPVGGAAHKGRSVIVAISDRPDFLKLVRSSLSAVPAYDVRELGTKSALGSGAGRTPADIVLLDVASGAILEDDGVFELRRSLASVPLIVVSEDLTPERMRRLVQLNATDWLHEPVNSRVLLDGVAEQLHGRRAHRSEVFAFIPCAGGAGATSLAISAAAHWSRKAGASGICLVDLDFVGGSCGRYLDMENEFELENVLKAPERIDLELLEILKRDNSAGFALLSFRRPDRQIAEITDEFVYRLLDIVTFHYTKVILDLPSYPAPWVEQTLRNSDQVFLITERTVPGLKNAKDKLEGLLRTGRSPDSIHLVLNKDRRRMFSVDIGAREIERLFQSKEIIFLPDNWPLASEALNRGVPVNAVNRRAKLVKRLGRALDRIALQKGRR